MRAVVDATVGGRGAPAPETFDFAPQSVTFSPPRYRWEAEGQLSGGLRGVRRRDVVSRTSRTISGRGAIEVETARKPRAHRAASHDVRRAWRSPALDRLHAGGGTVVPRIRRP